MIRAEGFPHGTPEGYELGCRGIACANRGSESLMTCEQAQVRFNGDFAYRKAVLAGTASAEKERFDGTRVGRRGSEVVAHEVTAPVLPTPTFDREEPVAASMKETPTGFEVFEKPQRRGGRQSKPIVHGTRYGYVRGCRDRAKCPAAVAGGESCKEAHNRYSRERKAARDGVPVAAAKAPKPAPVVIPAPTPVEIPEEAWALVTERAEVEALKERVAFLELELDVAKAQIRDEQRRLVALVHELFKEAS